MENVEVKEIIEGRVGLEVRNALIFELAGGAGNPTNAPYRIDIGVVERRAVDHHQCAHRPRHRPNW